MFYQNKFNNWDIVSTMIISIYLIAIIFFTTFTLPSLVLCLRPFSRAKKLKLREEVRGMFQHAYDGYLQYASDYDELRPLTCDGINTWGSYSLTLIDALDTLAVMGNYTEFRRVANLIVERMDFDNDINVSVFETNIRIVGGLLGAHLMSRRAGVELEIGWPCNGPLLRLAEDVAKRLLPAFDSKTGMPYGTVNLRHGVPIGETSVTCTAGVGTFIVEFGALSRLTGDPIYEEVALNAIYKLWEHRSPIGLLGNHIDVQTGKWTAQDAGIGAGVDSFFEYLVKGAIMLNRPDLLELFHEAREKIDKYMKREDWYVWVGMNKGQVTLPVFQSLEAYWPGVLSLIGDVNPALRTIHNYHAVWRQYGFLPELYNIPTAEAGVNRESYPLRPELAESAMYLYRATRNPYLLEVGEDMVRSIQYSAKTSCGYATIKDVRDHRRENRMESFFLSETTKYLYLLFDEDNFLHNDGGEGRLFETPNARCIIEAGGYIFNTEGHPIDPSALQCCHDIPENDLLTDFNLADYDKEVQMHIERERIRNDMEKIKKYTCPEDEISNESNKLQSLRQKKSNEKENTLKESWQAKTTLTTMEVGDLSKNEHCESQKKHIFVDSEKGNEEVCDKKPLISPSQEVVKKRYEPESDANEEQTTNRSILTDFVHSIISSAMPSKSKFDEQKFLKKIRSQGVYMNREQKYELLTCQAPRFIDRFAFGYEVV